MRPYDAIRRKRKPYIHSPEVQAVLDFVRVEFNEYWNFEGCEKSHVEHFWTDRERITHIYQVDLDSKALIPAGTFPPMGSSKVYILDGSKEEYSISEYKWKTYKEGTFALENLVQREPMHIKALVSNIRQVAIREHQKIQDEKSRRSYEMEVLLKHIEKSRNQLTS
jgi:hypothetical protein